MKNKGITWLLLIVCLGCGSDSAQKNTQPEIQENRSGCSDLAYNLINIGWNKTTTKKPVFYIAADVDPEWENTASQILDDVMGLLGNYGPIHIFGLGTDEAAAELIIKKWGAMFNDPICSKKSRPHEWDLVNKHTSDAFASLVCTVEPPIKAIVMGLGTLNRDTKKILVHEYVHVYQMSLLLDKAQDEKQFPTWLVEGGAEFFASYYAETQKWDSFTETMRSFLQEARSDKPATSLKENETYAGFNMGKNIWGVAYLIHLSSMDALYRGFNKDIYTKGWVASFEEHFKITVKDFYKKFAAFLDLSELEQMAILPTQPLNSLIRAAPNY